MKPQSHAERPYLAGHQCPAGEYALSQGGGESQKGFKQGIDKFT